MPTDANILVQGRPVEPFNPAANAELMARVQDLRAQAQQRMFAAQDNAAINAGYQALAIDPSTGQPKVDPTTGQPKVPDPFDVADYVATTGGNARAAMSLRTQALKQQGDSLTNAKLSNENRSATLKVVTNMLSGLPDDPTQAQTQWPSVVAAAKANGIQLPPSYDPSFVKATLDSATDATQKLTNQKTAIETASAVRSGQINARQGYASILAGANASDYGQMFADLRSHALPDDRAVLDEYGPTFSQAVLDKANREKTLGASPTEIFKAQQPRELASGASLVAPNAPGSAVPFTTVATGTPERTMESYDVGGTNVRLATDKQGRAYAPDGRPISPSPDGSWTYADGSKVNPAALPKAPLPASVIVNNLTSSGAQAPIVSTRPDTVEGKKVDPATGLTPNAIYNQAILQAMGAAPPISQGMGSNPRRQAQFQAVTNSANQMIADAGVDPAQLRADYKANSATLSKLLPRVALIDTAMNTANDNLNLALQHSADVQRTGSPLANRFVNWANGDVLVGNPALTKFETDIYTASREYAKVTSGGAASAQGLTDSASKEAGKLLNAAQTPEAFQAAAQEMQADMRNFQGENLKTINGVSSTIAKFLSAQTGVPAPTSTQTQDTSQSGSFSVPYGGKTYTFKTQAALDGFKKEMGIK
jgi:hypothetical protein